MNSGALMPKNVNIYENLLKCCIFWISATNKVCNETLTSSSGWIASPDFDDDGYYDHYLNCFWTVHVKDNDVVFFQVLFVQIQYAEGCLHDYLEVC